MTRSEVFGVPLDLLTMTETVQRCVQLVESQRPAQHVVINASKVVLMEEVPGLREIVKSCDVVNADGQSVVWAGRLLGLGVPERVTGIDLMHRLLYEAEDRGWPVFFLGAREDALASCVSTLLGKHPGLVIAGTRNGYFDSGEEIAALVRDSGARLLLVGMPSPRKEFFLASHLHEMGSLLAMGVGGSFDVVAGHTQRAPVWMQRAGLEWAHRLLQEPGRMWRRYLVGNAKFLGLALREVVRKTFNMKAAGRVEE